VEFSLRYRLSETLITLFTINASIFERYQTLIFNGVKVLEWWIRKAERSLCSGQVHPSLQYPNWGEAPKFSNIRQGLPAGVEAAEWYSRYWDYR
jgi:hypothetical protein